MRNKKEYKKGSRKKDQSENCVEKNEKNDQCRSCFM
jgi:hypothetical protein